uniref:hypothetical protein n=1 Tax=Vibrio hyugaensis TaxID=1534743 RepID=UPI0005EFC878
HDPDFMRNQASSMITGIYGKKQGPSYSFQSEIDFLSLINKFKVMSLSQKQPSRIVRLGCFNY